MARLREDEKRELLRATGRRREVPATSGAGGPGTPVRMPMSPREFAEFATFASRFGRVRKAVRFDGAFWRL